MCYNVYCFIAGLKVSYIFFVHSVLDILYLRQLTFVNDKLHKCVLHANCYICIKMGIQIAVTYRKGGVSLQILVPLLAFVKHYRWDEVRTS